MIQYMILDILGKKEGAVTPSAISKLWLLLF